MDITDRMKEAQERFNITAPNYAVVSENAWYIIKDQTPPKKLRENPLPYELPVFKGFDIIKCPGMPSDVCINFSNKFLANKFVKMCAKYGYEATLNMFNNYLTIENIEEQRNENT